jgi:hypothetical protein
VDDAARAFGYFVYAGVPAWSTAAGHGLPAAEFSAAAMGQLPVFHLLAAAADVADAMHWPPAAGRGYTGSEYRWAGTLVHNGTVYDNVGFRPRGGPYLTAF